MAWRQDGRTLPDRDKILADQGLLGKEVGKNIPHKRWIRLEAGTRHTCRRAGTCARHGDGMSHRRNGHLAVGGAAH